MYKEDPFVFPDQVKQVYYVQDPTKPNSNWKIIERFTHRHLLDIPLDDDRDYLDGVQAPSTTLSVDVQEFDNFNFRRQDGELEEVAQTDAVLHDHHVEEMEDDTNESSDEPSLDDNESSSDDSGTDTDNSDDEFE